MRHEFRVNCVGLWGAASGQWDFCRSAETFGHSQMSTCCMDDSSLLKAFAHTGDERAFRELVERHVDLVYASARRQLRDAHLAEDVTQAVFVVLARRAGSVRSGAVLPAWLLATTRYVARDVMRSE